VQMRLVGGGSEIQSYLATLRVTDMKVVNTEKEIGRDWETQYQNWATPRASVELLRQLWNEYQRNRGEKGIGGAAEELSGAPLVIRFMVDSVTGPKRLRGLLAKGGLFVAHKTGTGGTRNGINSATNDIGLITIAEGKTVAIAVYVSDSSADEKTRELVIAKIAKAVETRWAGR
jgi:beta-lactamase class A